MKSNSFFPLAALVLILISATIVPDSVSFELKRSVGESLRSTRCPSGNDLLRYDESRRQCYEVGSKGPCGKNMIFYSVADSDRLGTCDCAYAHEARTLIYHAASNQCYFLFQQGYCRAGQWLTFNRNTRQPMCEANPCLTKAPRNLLETHVLYEGTCVPLNAPCNSTRGVVKFVSGFVLPRCTIPHASSQAVGAPVQGCAPGSFKAYNGKCVPIFEW